MTVFEVSGVRALEFARGVFHRFDGNPPKRNLVSMVHGGWNDWPNHFILRIDKKLNPAAKNRLIVRASDFGVELTEQPG